MIDLDEIMALLEDAMYQGCHNEAGWLHTGGISTWRDVGDYLVEHADWEKHPDGKPGSRIQLYRPPQEAEAWTRV